MDNKKKLKLTGTTGAILTILAGLIFTFAPEGARTACMIIIGIVILLTGIMDIALNFKAKGTTYVRNNLFTGIIKAIAGAFIIISPGTIPVALSYVLSIFILIQAIAGMITSYRMLRASIRGGQVSFILSLFVIFICISMLVRPTAALNVASVWFGLLLIIVGAINLVIGKKVANTDKTVDQFYRGTKYEDKIVEADVVIEEKIEKE